jgi:hypothetical protein
LKTPSHLILDFESYKHNNNNQFWFNSNNVKSSSLQKDSLKLESSLLKENDKISFEDNFTNYFRYGNNNTYYFPLNSNANINFLRKEKLYTKLKYSRSPAYDIVSGGMAALLAGFIGFLISEKFGFELVDSGDFYFLFMYIVFLCFSIRPLLTTMNAKTTFIEAISLKSVLKFYLNIFYFIFKR